MTEETPKTCAYPGCEAIVPEPEQGGPTPGYCDNPEHNAHSMFRALQSGEGETARDTAGQELGESRHN